MPLSNNKIILFADLPAADPSNKGYTFVTSDTDQVFTSDGVDMIEVATGGPAVDLLPLNNTWTGVNRFQNQVNIENLGEANPRLQIGTSGQLEWGDGTDPIDTNLARTGVAHLAMASGIFQADLLWANSAVLLLADAKLDATAGSGGATNVIIAAKSTDAFARYKMDRSGKMQWANGSDDIAVTASNLYRPQVAVLKSDGRFQADDGLTTKIKAGIPTDGDFLNTPSDGTMVLDTANERLYVRTLGAWKYSALV